MAMFHGYAGGNHHDEVQAQDEKFAALEGAALDQSEGSFRPWKLLARNIHFSYCSDHSVKMC